MNQLLSYLLQVLIASAILYCYYHFALRNKKFHRYNRFYLMMALIISAGVPFLNIPVYFTSEETNYSAMLQIFFASEGENTQIIVSSGEVDSQSILQVIFSNIFYIIYFLVCTVFLIRIFFSLNKIRILVRNNTVEFFDKIKFVNTDQPGTPFSFFRWLFWNKKIDMQSEKGEQIFRHELFHIQQRHSWDIIFTELLTTVFWINPFFHLMKKEIKAIHEFLADEFAIKENNNWQYAELLLMQVLNTNNQLVNPFFHNQIKRRIAMITTSSKPSYQYLRKIMVLPVAAIIIVLFAFNYKTQKDNVTDLLETHYTNADTTKPLAKPEFDNYTVVLDGIVQEKKGLKNIDTTLFGEGKHFEITIFNDSTGKTKYGAIAKDGIIEIDTKQKDGSNKITVKKNLPTPLTKYVTLSDTIKPQPLLVINGKQMPGLRIKELDKMLSPSDIESMSVLKGDTAINKYGEKGKNGAVEIVAKKIKEIEIRPSRPANEIDDLVFTKVEIEPSFPGGVIAWRKFLTENLNPNVPVDSGANEGKYTVILQFIVDKDGGISDLKALTDHGFGMEQECLRIMKLSPKWTPAVQKGKNVKAYRKQPITFVIASDVDEEPLKEIKVTGYKSPTKSNVKLDASKSGEVKEITVTGHKISDAKQVDKLAPIYPNPATNNLTIPFDSKTGEEVQIRVYDLLASLKMEKKIDPIKGKANLHVDVSSLVSGTYMINIIDSKGNILTAYKMIKK